MSQAYEISVCESVRRHIVVADGICTGLELLDVLPRDQMARLLGAELKKLGFESEGASLRRISAEGVVVEIDPLEATVKVSLEQETDFEAQRDFKAQVWEEVIEQGRAALKVKGRAALEREADAAEADLQGEVVQILERQLLDLRAELDRAVNRTVGAALKHRAAQLGEITELTEDEHTGDVTIRVRL